MRGEILSSWHLTYELSGNCSRLEEFQATVQNLQAKNEKLGSFAADAQSQLKKVSFCHIYILQTSYSSPNGTFWAE